MSRNISASRVLFHLALGLAGSMLVMALLFYAVSEPGKGIRPSQILTALGNSSPWMFVLYAVIGLTGVWLRAIRYRILIRAAGETPEMTPGARDMFMVTAVRGMAVDLLPLRLGELVYVVLLRRVAGTSIYAGLTSLLFAALLDAAVLAPFTVVLGLFIGFPNSAPVKVAIAVAFVIVMFFVGIRYILPKVMTMLESKAGNWPKILSSLFDIAEKLNQSIQQTLRAGVFWRTIYLTAGVRILKYSGLYILFVSVAAGSFPALEAFPGGKVIGAMIASEMTASLPLPTLMSFGSWEAGGTTFLALMGAPPSVSLVALFAIHILSQAVDYSIGLAGLYLLFSARLRSSVAGLQTRQSWTIWLVLALAVAALTMSWNWLQSRSAEQATSAGLESATAAKGPEWTDHLAGFMVWSSNRSGNHDIWMMQLPDRKISRITRHPNTETHPRISPDGSSIVFSRSHKEWQSWRDQAPWSVWIRELESGNEIQVTDQGIAPTWSADGDAIYFQRGPGEIWVHNLDSGDEKRLYQRNVNGIPDSELYYPSMSRDRKLAVTFRDHGRPTNITSTLAGDVNAIARGCMLTWSPLNDFALFISSSKGGKQKNQINRYDPETGAISEFIDLPGELSHEYFPRLDPAQKYLVFAASDGAHEPDIEDYEIFLWDTASPAGAAWRVTHDPANDSWPDIFLYSNN